MLIDVPFAVVTSLFLVMLPLGWFIARQRREADLLKQKNFDLTRRLEELQSSLHKELQLCEEFRQKCHEYESRVNSLSLELEFEKRSFDERLKVYQSAEDHLKDTFKILSQDALKANYQGLMHTAQSVFEKYETMVTERLEKKEEAIANLVKPVYQSLERFDQKVQDIERQRIGAYEGISQQIKIMMEAHRQLQHETGSLVSALRSPTTRGQWGELQLRRVVEIAGMLAYCDFYEQKGGDQKDRSLRPDMVIKLPGNRSIVVDAKAPLQAYLEAIETQDERRRGELFREHAQLIRKQVQHLSQKSYWDNFEQSPEFVLLFLPGESFFSVALQVDPQLIEIGIQQKVILATPTTLIALLRTTAYAWRQEAMAENAKEIAKLGQTLYRRLGDLSTHFHDLGRHLNNTIGSYNKAVGNLESRVFVSARRFQELQADDPKKEIKSMESIELRPRELAKELECP